MTPIVPTNFTPILSISSCMMMTLHSPKFTFLILSLPTCIDAGMRLAKSERWILTTPRISLSMPVSWKFGIFVAEMWKKFLRGELQNLFLIVILSNALP